MNLKFKEYDELKKEVEILIKSKSKKNLKIKIRKISKFFLYNGKFRIN